MITEDDIQQVARSAEPLLVGEGKLTISDLIRLPRTAWDWDFYQLTDSEAERLAAIWTEAESTTAAGAPRSRTRRPALPAAPEKDGGVRGRRRLAIAAKPE